MKRSQKSQALEILRGAGLKATSVRKALLDVLSVDHGPFTLEELHQRVKKTKCDLVTMYRTLAVFQKARLVQRCDFGDGPVRFELRHEGEGHHHHVVCTQCRRVKSLDGCVVEEIERLLKKEGYVDVTHSLEFFGTCRECAQKT